MAKKYGANNTGGNLNFIMIAVIAVVLALGIYAIYNSVHKTRKQDKLDNYNATIAQRADTLGLEADEFLKLYGLSDSGLKGSDSEQTAYEKMTLANYVKYSSGSELTDADLEEFKEKMGDQLGDVEVAPDSTDMTLKGLYSSYAQQKAEEEQAAQQAASEATGAGTAGAVPVGEAPSGE